MALSDRILVVCAGRITGERRPEDTNQQDLGLLMAGVSEHAA
jgi:simple sugar transport system ATP-binding protein